MGKKTQIFTQKTTWWCSGEDQQEHLSFTEGIQQTGNRRIRASSTAAGFCFVCCEEMERATAVLTLAINFYATKQTDQWSIFRSAQLLDDNCDSGRSDASILLIHLFPFLFCFSCSRFVFFVARKNKDWMNGISPQKKEEKRETNNRKFRTVGSIPIWNRDCRTKNTFFRFDLCLLLLLMIMMMCSASTCCCGDWWVWWFLFE